MNKEISENGPKIQNDDLRINLAIGTLTLYTIVVLLIALNYCIHCFYHPDVASIIKNATAISFMAKEAFLPEPVEKLQFLLSIICTPIFTFFVFNRIKSLRNRLLKKPLLAYYINLAGVNIFILYLVLIFQQGLLHLDKTTGYFFVNNLIYKTTLPVGLCFYGFAAYGLVRYAELRDSMFRKIVVNVISFQIVAVVLFQLVLCNVFQFGKQDYEGAMETNAVFYSMTQVFAGKSLLVNINCQYGLYAWFLTPLFRLTGLSIYSFSWVMGILNALSFLCIFLGVKKIIRQDVLALVTFLAVIFWQYWQSRLPIAATPRLYYQYWPLRILFPSVAFCLIVSYFTAGEIARKRLLPVLALVAGFSVLWNFDSGLVVFVAVSISLLFSAFYSCGFKESLKSGIVYVAWMSAALFAAVALFSVTTKMKSGMWPDFRHLLDFQTYFYVSGYFMLPMPALHLWNVPIVVYVIVCIYCVFKLRKTYQAHVPVAAFLFILGLGIFAYFQGRSYDTNLPVVIYPAIILMGIFCDQLLSEVIIRRSVYHVVVMLFFIPFIFLTDAAFSMLNYVPAIHSMAWSNIGPDTSLVKKIFCSRADFIAKNIPRNDTVLILCRDFESYYYATGNYYNPVNTPGSTELFLKSDLFACLDVIRARKYPVIYDVAFPWSIDDTLVKTLSENTVIDREIIPARNFVLFRPVRQHADKQYKDPDVIYYYNHFSNLPNPSQFFPRLELAETFTIELYISPLDTSLLSGACWIFNNATSDAKNSGILMAQRTSDLTVFEFVFGDGTRWCGGVPCKLSCTMDNNVVIKVNHGVITVYNNSKLAGSADTKCTFRNSIGVVHFNSDFPGTVREVRVLKR